MRTTLPTGTAVELATPGGSSDPDPVGLVIAPDIFGLRPLYDDMASRLALEWGIPVAAVEPFPGWDLGPEVEARFAAVSLIDDDAHLADLHAAADLLGAENTVLMGFCLGGMYCFKAARSSRFDRIASFYGMIRLPEAWHGPGQREPLAAMSAGHADRVLAIIGGQDHYTPPHDVDALASAGAHVVRYPEAEHGFAHDATRPAHRPDDAADAFTAARAWLLG